MFGNVAEQERRCHSHAATKLAHHRCCNEARAPHVLQLACLAGSAAKTQVLHVELEVHHVAVAHNVVFAFLTKTPRSATASFSLIRNVIVV